MIDLNVSSMAQEISTLIWNDFLYPLVPQQKQKLRRGRPSIQEARPGEHYLSDVNDNSTRSLLPLTLHKIKLDFIEFINEKVQRRQAIENIAKLYDIPYQQAYNICEKL